MIGLKVIVMELLCNYLETSDTTEVGCPFPHDKSYGLIAFPSTEGMSASFKTIHHSPWVCREERDNRRLLNVLFT